MQLPILSSLSLSRLRKEKCHRHRVRLNPNDFPIEIVALNLIKIEAVPKV
jgi:hypothetical protein